MSLPRRDIWVTLTVFLALGGLGMMFIFSGLIGFGVHSLIGKISLYICFSLQVINVAVIFIRRHYLSCKYGAPASSKKMRRFTTISFLIWCLGAMLLLFSLAANLFWFSATKAAVRYPCVIGACIAPIGWLGLLAAFHRRREAAMYAAKQPAHNA